VFLICDWMVGIRTGLKCARYLPAGKYRSERRTKLWGSFGRNLWTTNERATASE